MIFEKKRQSTSFLIFERSPFLWTQSYIQCDTSAKNTKPLGLLFEPYQFAWPCKTVITVLRQTGKFALRGQDLGAHVLS
jgi:hypothetical protein